MSEWQPIDTVPKDGSPMELWHVTWKCVISCQWDTVNPKGAEFPWLEVSRSNRWPVQSFTHWRPLSDRPLEPTNET